MWIKHCPVWTVSQSNACLQQKDGGICSFPENTLQDRGQLDKIPNRLGISLSHRLKKKNKDVSENFWKKPEITCNVTVQLLRFLKDRMQRSKLWLYFYRSVKLFFIQEKLDLLLTEKNLFVRQWEFNIPLPTVSQQLTLVNKKEPYMEICSKKRNRCNQKTFFDQTQPFR